MKYEQKKDKEAFLQGYAASTNLSFSSTTLTCAWVADQQHVDVAADVHAGVGDACEAADEHEQQRQLDGEHAVQLRADAGDYGVPAHQRC